MRRKYHNISGERLVIDCVTETVFMESDSIQSLPISRDVRLNVRLRKLVPVREIREELKVVETKPVEAMKIKKNWKEKAKPAIDNEDKQENGDK